MAGGVRCANLSADEGERAKTRKNKRITPSLYELKIEQRGL
jgi:hypothetical protein